MSAAPPPYRKGAPPVAAETATVAAFTAVGRPVERLDGRAKATGAAVYAADIELPNMLHGRLVRSPHAHARLLGIDASAALAVPGVVTVLTAKDVPGRNAVGSRGVQDQPILVIDHVRFLAEPVAMVVAETPQAAAEGVSKVKVDYEPLPGAFTPEQALAPGAPQLHEKGNLCHQARTRRGDFDAARREATLEVTNVYRTPMVDHAFLEPHAAAAEPDGTDGVTVWVTAKTVHPLLDEIARILDWPAAKVCVIAATVGGSFGGKPEIPLACLVALAAVKTGQPVRMVYTREETFQTSAKRHPYVVALTHAVAADGRILGIKADITADAGAYTTETRAVIGRAVGHCAGPYYVPNVDIEGRGVFTNNPSPGAMRGYGVPQVAFAHEVQMDIIAEKLGLDPVEVRLRNIVKPGLTTITGQPVLEGVGAEASLLGIRDMLAAENAADPLPPRGTPDAHGELAGWGVGTFYYGNGRTAVADVGRARIRLEADGAFTLFVGVPDVGQGSNTILAQIACEELGVPWESVKVVAADTGQTLESGPSSASRVTVVVGRAVQEAARRMRACLESTTGPSRPSTADPTVGLPEFAAEYKTDGTALDADGQGLPYGTYTYGVQAVKVGVDPLTGKVTVRKVLASYDVGPVINPMLFQGQVEGGVAGGIGYALYEEVRLADGRVTNPNFHTYLLPTASDAAAPVVAETVESSDGAGPFGAKGIGEPASIPTAPAIANAIHQATGSRFLELPITMEKVYRSLRR